MRRLLTGLLVTLLVLGGLAAVGDELLRREAEKRVATVLAERLGSTPTVEAGGWPFTAMLWTHRLGSAHVAADQISGRVDGQQVTVTDLDVVAKNITDPTDLDRARAAAVVVRATGDWETLSRRLGVELSGAGQGRVKARATVAGVPVELVGVPVTKGDGLSLTDASGTIAGQPLEQAQLDAAIAALEPELELPTVEGFTPDSVEVVDDGLRLGFVGHDVAVSRFR